MTTAMPRSANLMGLSKIGMVIKYPNHEHTNAPDPTAYDGPIIQYRIPLTGMHNTVTIMKSNIPLHLFFNHFIYGMVIGDERRRKEMIMIVCI